MNLATVSSRLAVGGVTAALATAGLMGVTTTAASAAPVSTTYSCSAAGQTFPVPVSVDIALLPTTAPAGFPVPAGLLSYNTTLTIPGAVQGLLDAAGVTGAHSEDFGTAFGDTVAKAPATWTKPAAADVNGNWIYTGKGANGAFTLPKAGTYSVNMSKTFVLTTSGGAAIPVTCTNAAPTAIGSITLSKQTPVIKAKAPKSAKVGATVTVKGKIANDYSKTGGVAPSGKVTVLDGKKKVGTGTIKKGKFTVKVKGLKAGAHSLTVAYAGDDFTDKGVSSKALKLTVKA